MPDAPWSWLPRDLRDRLEVTARDLRHIARTLRGERPSPVVARPAKPPRPAAPTPALTPAARPLRVVSVHRETPDAVSLTLEPFDGTTLHFTPGQFLTLQVELEGATLRRAYSLSSSALDPSRVTVTVKRVADGRVSRHLNERVSPGDVIAALGPSGSFTLPRTGSPVRALLVAGGSGITPLMSFLRTHLGAAPEIHFTLLYGNRDLDAVIFRDELDALAARYPAQLRVVHALEHPPHGWHGAVGRLDEATLARALDALDLHAPHELRAFLCGPEPMMHAARATLRARGVADEHIREERFTLGRTKARADDAPHLVRVRLGAREREVSARPGTTVLDAGLAAGLPMPHSCTMGGCGACMVKLTAGDVAMDEPNCLTARERAEGMVLACCARPRGDVSVEVPA